MNEGRKRRENKSILKSGVIKSPGKEGKTRKKKLGKWKTRKKRKEIKEKRKQKRDRETARDSYQNLSKRETEKL